MPSDFELAVVGSGPAGQKAAIQAAKLRKRVCLIERRRVLGGNSLNVGTVPSKTIREAVMYLTGFQHRAVYGQDYRVKADIGVEDLSARVRHVVEKERAVVRDQLIRNRVTIVEGTARFVDPHTVAVADAAGIEKRISADKFVLAPGSAPARPPEIAFNGRTVLDSDDIVLRLDHIPHTLVVVGAGVIGVEFASMFAALGTRVTLIDGRPQMLDFVDAEVVEGLRYHLRDLNVIFRFGEKVTAVEDLGDETVTTLASGKQILGEAVFYSAGRQGAVDLLELENAGLEADDRGRIEVDEFYRTSVEHIYAAGDVVGWPSLSSSAAEQGRIASAHACGIEVGASDPLLPIGIYSIPEISYVGQTEAELTAASIPYESGVAHYRELARGQIIGDTHGMVKLLVSSTDGKLLGVHAFGAGATELIHIGQAVLGLGGTVDYLVNTVFNYPTLAEAYKVAALDAANKLRAVRIATATAPALPA